MKLEFKVIGALLSRISIGKKIMLMLLFPLMGLIYFSISVVSDRNTISQEMSHIEPLAFLAEEISHLVHETQKERGATAGYLGSKGKRFADILPAQHGATDTKVTEIKSFIQELDINSYGTEFATLLSSSLSRLDQLSEIRKNILSLEMATPKAIAFYSQTNKMFLDTVGKISSLTNNGVVARNISAYYNFLLGKERAGIERAVLSNTFAADTFGPGMYEIFRTLVSEQETYVNVFLSLATVQQREFYQQKMDNSAIEDVEKMRSIASTFQQREQLVSEIRSHLGYGGMIHNFKNYVLRGQDKHFKNFKKHQIAVIKLLDQYAALPGILEGSLALIKTVRDTVEAYDNGIAKSASLRAGGADISVIDRSVKISDGPALDAINKLGLGNFGIDSVHWYKTQTIKINLLKEVDDYLSKSLVSQVGQLASEANQQQFFYLVLSLLAIGLALIISFAVARSVTGNLVKTVNLLQDIAEGEGDLTQRLEVNGTDEIAQLSGNFNKFAGRIEEMVIEVKEVAQSIRVSAGEIAMGNTDLSHRTEEQASSLEETAASMEEMTASVKQNADNARQANQLVSSTRDLAAKGGETVQRTVAAMEEINTSSRKVADIISVIDGIAFQTNLLALNAAVEAARAGEQGRGFAVVAGEVRNLAGRSAEAAKEIKGLIEDSVQKAEHGTALVDESGRTLEEIVTGVKKVADIVSEIASASQEQSTGIGEVGSAITQMDEVTQQNAALVEQAAAASESMEEQSNQLIDEMSAFKVSE